MSGKGKLIKRCSIAMVVFIVGGMSFYFYNKVRGEKLPTPQILVKEALKIGGGSMDPFCRALVFKHAAPVLVEMGEKELARKTLERALKDARKTGFSHFVTEIIECMAEIGEIEEALKAAKELSDPILRLYALSHVAREMVKKGEVEKGLKIFDWAMKTIKKTKDKVLRLLASLTIASEMAKAGEEERGREIISGILRESEELKNPKDRLKVLTNVAYALEDIGKGEWAIEVIQSALRIIHEEGIKDESSRIYELSETMAEIMAEKGKFEEALRIAQTLKDTFYRSSILASVSISMAEAGRVGRALKIAEGIEYQRYRSDALGMIAVILMEDGRKKQARKIFKHALKVALRNKRQRDWALMDVAKYMAEAGEFEWAYKVSRQIRDPIERSIAFIAIAKHMAEHSKRK